jgi:hypothetical protein
VGTHSHVRLAFGRAASGWVSYAAVSVAAGVVLMRLLLAEQGMTAPSYYPKVSRPPGLLPHEEEYVS